MDMLVIDPQGRETCDQLAMDLRGMLENCQENEDYATKAAPWSAKVDKASPVASTAEWQSHSGYTHRGTPISGMAWLEESNRLECGPTSSRENGRSTK